MKSLNPIPKRSKSFKSTAAFSLTETLVAVAIVSTLGTLAIPAYLDQKQSGCQGYPITVISQVMEQAQAYNDEYGQLAEGWTDLNKIGAVMTKKGPAEGSSFSPVDLPGCGYRLKGTLSGSSYVFDATQAKAIIEKPETGEITVNASKNQYNAVGCINVFTGASDIQEGDGSREVKTENLNCNRS